jgi:predicted DNA-binding transcriptional regulator YafY
MFAGVDSTKTGQVFKKLSALFKKSAADWLQVDFSDWNSSGSAVFNNFKTAILERRITEFDYYGTSGTKTLRRIEPIQLWFKSKAWYIIGFCLTRKDLRTFKLTRVKNLKVTNKHFTVRDNLPFPLNTTEDEKQKLVAMKFKIEPEMTYRVFDDFFEEITEKLPDGSYIVSVKWPMDFWVFGFILSFGEHIEVLEPKSLRKTIKNMIAKIGRKYS